jgi:cytochrome o ubiquinol oxidase subunit 1
MFGRLSWSAIPLDQPIVMGTGAVLGIVLFSVFLLVTLKGAWPYLWREWITSVSTISASGSCT